MTISCPFFKKVILAIFIISATVAQAQNGDAPTPKDIADCIDLLIKASGGQLAEQKMSESLKQELVGIPDQFQVTAEILIKNSSSALGLSFSEFIETLRSINKRILPGAIFSSIGADYNPKENYGSVRLHLPKAMLVKVLESIPSAEFAMTYEHDSKKHTWIGIEDLYVSDLSRPLGRERNGRAYFQLAIPRADGTTPAQAQATPIPNELRQLGVTEFKVPEIKPFDPKADAQADGEESSDRKDSDDEGLNSQRDLDDYMDHLNPNGLSELPFKFFIYSISKMMPRGVVGLPINPYIEHHFLNTLGTYDDALKFWLRMTFSVKPTLEHPEWIYSQSVYGQLDVIKNMVHPSVSLKMAELVLKNYDKQIREFHQGSGEKYDREELKKKMSEYLFEAMDIALKATAQNFHP